MTLPTRIAALVTGGDLVLPTDSEVGDCEGSRFHSPTPLVVHQVPVVPEQWTPYPTKARGATVALCGTCRDNYGFLCEVFAHYDGTLPPGMLKEMGNQMRALVRTAWTTYRGGSGE